VAKAANPPFLPLEAELLADNLQRGVVIRGVVDREVADLLMDLVAVDDLEDGLRDLLASVPVLYLREAENNFVRLALTVSEYCTDAVERKAVARSPSIEDQMNLPGALSEGLGYCVLVPLKLSHDDGVDSLLREVEKREEVAEVRVFDRAERKVGADELSHDPPLELGSVERANQPIGHLLIARVAHVEFEVGADSLRPAALATGTGVSRQRSLARRVGNSMGV